MVARTRGNAERHEDTHGSCVGEQTWRQELVGWRSKGFHAEGPGPGLKEVPRLAGGLRGCRLPFRSLPSDWLPRVSPHRTLQQWSAQSGAPIHGTLGVEEKLTTNALYTGVFRELLATAQPGRTPKQARRYPVAVLESFEELVVCESATFYLRVYAWWLLLQCWGTLRFADHRGLNPGKGFEVKGNALTGSEVDAL